MQPRHSTGFTLIELMVVVAIVAILAVMAAPSYRDMIDRFRVRGAADDVLSVLSNARAGAVKSGLDTAVGVAGLATSSWCVGATSAAVPTGGNPAGVATACTCTDAVTCTVAGEQLVVPVGKHGGVTLTSGGGLVYDGKLGIILTGGLVTAAANPMVLTSPSGRYDVQVGVSPLGQATLCTPSGKPAMAGISTC